MEFAFKMEIFETPANFGYNVLVRITWLENFYLELLDSILIPFQKKLDCYWN